MSKPVPKPHRLKVYILRPVGGDLKLTVGHEDVYPSKCDAIKAKREFRYHVGSRYSSATITPEIVDHG